MVSCTSILSSFWQKCDKKHLSKPSERVKEWLATTKEASHPEEGYFKLSRAKLTIVDLPSDTHHLIFDYLDPISSTCHGLASKNLYPIHRANYGTVRLHTNDQRGPGFWTPFGLYPRLREWIPRDMVYDRRSERFVMRRELDVNRGEGWLDYWVKTNC